MEEMKYLPSNAVLKRDMETQQQKRGEDPKWVKRHNDAMMGIHPECIPCTKLKHNVRPFLMPGQSPPQEIEDMSFVNAYEDVICFIEKYLSREDAVKLVNKYGLNDAYHMVQQDHIPLEDRGC